MDKQLTRIEAKVDVLIDRVNTLRTDLEVLRSRVKLSSFVISAIASLAVAIGAVLLKGCV